MTVVHAQNKMHAQAKGLHFELVPFIIIITYPPAKKLTMPSNKVPKITCWKAKMS